MRIQFKERPEKLVFVWISEAEGRDPKTIDSITGQYAAWLAAGYTPITMESGRGDLERSMGRLMERYYNPDDEANE